MLYCGASSVNPEGEDVVGVREAQRGGVDGGQRPDCDVHLDVDSGPAGPGLCRNGVDLALRTVALLEVPFC